MVEGLCFKIGEGSDVSVWHDKCLTDVNNPELETHVLANLEDIGVSNLIVPNYLEWDIKMLKELFTPHDDKEVSSIPLSFANERDNIIWSHTTNRAYSVKSSYNLCMKLAGTFDNLKLDGIWSLIDPSSLLDY